TTTPFPIIWSLNLPTSAGKGRGEERRGECPFSQGRPAAFSLGVWGLYITATTIVRLGPDKSSRARERERERGNETEPKEMAARAKSEGKFRAHLCSDNTTIRASSRQAQTGSHRTANICAGIWRASC